MKAKYIILSALTALAAMAVGCTTANLTGSDIEGIKVESSYLQMAPEGGSVTLTFTANDSWELFEEASYTWKDADNKSYAVDTLIAPDGASLTPHGVKAFSSWLTADKTSGSAGENKVTLSAPSSNNYTTVQLHLVSGGKTQFVTVSQNESVVSPATCAEIIAGPDGKVYMTTGICTSIANTSYGNWYLQDATGEVYIYGTVDATGAYNWASFDIAVGDEVTVQGPKTTYNGTVELVDVSVLKVKKALLQIVDPTDYSFSSSAASFDIRALAKGNDFTFSSDSDWLNVASVKTDADTTLVKINVLENTSAEARKGTIDFTSTSGKSVSTLTVTVVQAGLKGATPDNPYSVSEIISAIAAGTVGSSEVYIKGKVSAILYTFSASYGTGTFWISDDGTANGVSSDKKSTTEPTKDFECYSVKWFGGEKWANGNAQLEIGDEVIIYGQTTLYNGISETASGKAWVYSVNDVTSDANGLGNASYPFNIAGAIDCIEARAAAEAGTVFNDVCVKGKISAILYTFSASYGTGTFWISDDGTAYGIADDKKSTTEPTKDFECYGVYWYNNQGWTDSDPQPAVGDEVVVKGQLTKYGSTYETGAALFFAGFVLFQRNN